MSQQRIGASGVSSNPNDLSKASLRLGGATCVALVLIVGGAATARAQTTALYLESQAGDFVGAGEVHTYVPAGVTFTVSNTANVVNMSVIAPDFTTWWYLNFSASPGASIGPGTYLSATRYPFNGNSAGLSVYGNGRGCNEVTGRFVIRELGLGAGDAVERLAVDFEQHCEDADAGLFGAVRYHSTVSTLIPFDGAYPDYRLTIAPPAHGAVRGDGVACSTTESTCTRSLLAPGIVGVTATPDPGYLFIGWRGSCRGPATIAVHLNQRKACEALFDSTTAPTARTGLFLDSQPGDFIGQGQQWLYDGSTSAWTVDWTEASHRALRINVTDLQYWTLEFDHGAGGVLIPGSYLGATRYPFNGNSAGLNVSGNGRGCNELTGWFFVRELVTALDGTIARFAADFEQHCEHGAAALFGAVRYNSTVPSLTPFDGVARPAVTTNPENQTILEGERVQFTAAAFSIAPVTVQWQVSTNGGSVFTSIPGATGSTFALTALAAESGRQFRAAITNVSGTETTNAATLTVARLTAAMPTDFDGDAKDELVIWRPGAGIWYWTASSSGSNAAAGARQWGSRAAGDVPLTGDIDGDGRADLIVWRGTTGTWYWLTSSSGYNYAAAGNRTWGTAGDIPMLGDIDGDGKADLVIWRPATGMFFWLTSSSGYIYSAAGQKQWGSQSAGDTPMLGDFDGDGRADLTIWRASTGMWFWLTSSSEYSYAGARQRQWGAPSLGDRPLAADIDGDGKTDLVVWRGSTGTWFWLTSSSEYTYSAAGQKQWGSPGAGDVPFMPDVDGDGKADLAVWRGSTGTWHWVPSGSGYDYGAAGSKAWGVPGGDVPIGR